jgi:hypothetical protein
LVGSFVVDQGRTREDDFVQGPQRTGHEETAMNDVILQEISDFCRQVGLAESTFGRRAVNDGKLASRLRNGGRITTETLDRIRGFMASHRDKPAREHLLGEVGGGEPRSARTAQHPSAAAGRAPVRRRRRRRLGADACDALNARPLPEHAVLRRR